MDKEEKNDKENDKDFYYKITALQATLLTSRGNFMLFFQSMLLTTVAILHGKIPRFEATSYLLVLGFLTAVLWLYVNFLTRLLETRAWAKLLELDYRVKELDEARKGLLSIPLVMAYPLPFLLGALWVFLLFKQLA